MCLNDCRRFGLHLRFRKSFGMSMHSVMQRRISACTLAAVGLLHLAILLAGLKQPPSPASFSNQRYAQLIFIAAPPPPPPPPMPASITTKQVAVSRSKLLPDKSPPAAMSQLPPEPIAEAPDPFATKPSFDIGSLVKSAARAERDTRPAGDKPVYARSCESMEAVLDRAFTKARLAVPPKWYVAARIERISAPNDPKEVYQITTAFGVYCMYSRQVPGHPWRRRQSRPSSAVPQHLQLSHARLRSV
jgi:hypothetical protein